jgi:crotonobetainyl-CoA:carnitine CoA-transferase CaiB-like acyl-CoA transferase
MGLPTLTGSPDDNIPWRNPVAAIDTTTSLVLAEAIMAALRLKEVCGYNKPQFLDVSLKASSIVHMGVLATTLTNLHKQAVREGNEYPYIVPYSFFPTSDGYLAVACASQKNWENLCHALGLTDLIENRLFSDNEHRVENRLSLNAILEQLFRQRTTKEWVILFKDKDVPVKKVQKVEEFLNSEVGQYYLMQCPYPKGVGEYTTTANPLVIAGLGSVGPSPPPFPGQHTTEVLLENGFTQEEIEHFSQMGIIHG